MPRSALSFPRSTRVLCCPVEGEGWADGARVSTVPTCPSKLIIGHSPSCYRNPTPGPLLFSVQKTRLPLPFRAPPLLAAPRMLLLPPLVRRELHREAHLSMPPPSSQLFKFLHWLTSKISSLLQPSTTASTPTPVTLTQPRTDSSLSSRRCSPMDRSEESETAEPQNESLSDWRRGQPRLRTSVAVSDSAQQNDYVL